MLQKAGIEGLDDRSRGPARLTGTPGREILRVVAFSTDPWIGIASSIREESSRRRARAAAVLLGTEGFVAAFGQALCVREILAVFGGNELLVGLAFFSWFFWIGIGAAAGALIARNFERAKAGALVAALAVPASTGASVPLVRWLGGILAGWMYGEGQVVGLAPGLLVCLGVLAPVGVSIGLLFPCAVRAASAGAGKKESGRRLALVYAAEAAGTFIGGVMFTFLFAGWVGQFRAAFFAAALGLAGAAWAARLLESSFAFRAGLVGAGAVLVVGLPLAGSAERASWRWSGTVPGAFGAIEQHDTRTQRVALARFEEGSVLYSNGRQAAVFPASPEDRLLVHACAFQARKVERAAVLGLEPGAVQELLAHGATEVDVVEMDRKLIKLVARTVEEAQVLKAEGVRVHILDPRVYLGRTRGLDLILLATGDPVTALSNRLYTVEAFRLAAGALSEGGVLSFSLTSQAATLDESGAAYLGSINRALEEAFPDVLLVPMDDTCLFLASTAPGALARTPQELMKRSRVVGNYRPEFAYSILLADRIERLERRLSGVGLPPNTDMRPAGYIHFLFLWGKFSRTPVGLILGFSRSLRLWMVAIFAAALAAALIAWRKPSASLVSCTVTTGLSGLALELVLVLAYQCLRGYVYERIALVAGLFMIGFVAGGLLMRKLLSKRRGRGLVLALEGAWAALALALPAVIGPAGRLPGPAIDALFALLVCGLGVLGGLELPLLGSVLLQRLAPERAAGLLDASDHIGACAGALITTVVLIPALGLGGTCLAVSLLKLATFLGYTMTGFGRSSAPGLPASTAEAAASAE